MTGEGGVRYKNVSESNAGKGGLWDKTAVKRKPGEGGVMVQECQ